MLTKLGQRGYAVHEDPAEDATGIDPDTDSDPDADGEHEQTDRRECMHRIAIRACGCCCSAGMITGVRRRLMLPGKSSGHRETDMPGQILEAQAEKR
jgi:hypothetical protein